MNKKRFVVIIPMFLILLSMLFSPIFVEASSKNIEKKDKSIEILDINKTVLIAATCEDAPFGDPSDSNSVAWLLQKILDYIRILGPTIAIVLGSIDFTKAIIASDADNMKKTEMRFVKRIIAAVMLFFIPMFVSILLDIVGLTCSGGLS